MKIPFFDMAREPLELIPAGLINDIEQVIRSGQYLFGPKCGELEQYFSEFFGVPAALVGSGTDALALSLKTLNIGPGKKVAIPALTAIPTAVAVKMVGAEPIYVDINGSCLNMCEIELEEKLQNQKIDAVIFVNLYGNSARLRSVKIICDHFKIPLVEDCAQSFGSTFRGTLTGLIGQCGAFSFYPSKNLGSFGDSGLVISKDINFINKIKQLRFYGQESRYKMGDTWGFNSRTDEIQAAILLKKTNFIKEHLEKRSVLLKKYYKALYKKFKIPLWQKGSVPHLFPILSNNREQLIKYLNSKEIETAIHYPFYLEQAIEKTERVSCPRAKKISQKVLSIPFHPWLTDEEVEYILKILGEFDENIANG